MEEIENDKMIYWVIFFAVLIVAAIVGHKYVFDYAAEKDKEEEKIIKDEEINTDDYIGIWQFYGDGELPLQEVLVNVVDGATITFDYYVNDVAYFESQTASLVDNVATFEINDRDELGTVKGKMIFKNDKVFFIIISSDIEGVNSGTYEFGEQSDESLLD